MEENKNGQGFWVESNFEPNPNYQPKRRQKAKGGTSKHKADLTPYCQVLQGFSQDSLE